MATRRPSGPPFADVEQLLREVLAAPLIVTENPYGVLQNPIDLSQLAPGLLYWSDHGELSVVNPTAVFAGVANPTASVGLAAVNGVALTAMRSDAAPPLSQAITPTWSGQHVFSLAPTFDIDSAAVGFIPVGTDVAGNWIWTDPELALADQLALLDLSDVVAKTGAGTTVVMQDTPTLVAPLLGTPTSGVLTNCTGLPIAGIAGLGSGIAAFLAVTKPTTIGGYGITDFVSLGDLEWSQLGHGHAAGEITGLGSFALISSLAHSALTGIAANDHHAQSHVLATNAALGGDHTVSGLTAGQVLRASGATAAAFTALVAGDIGGLGTLATQSGTFSGTHSGTSSGTNTGDQTIDAARTWATLQTFKDTTWKLVDDGDATKTLIASLGGLTAGADVTLAFVNAADSVLTFPNVTSTIAALSIAQTWSATQTFSPAARIAYGGSLQFADYAGSLCSITVPEEFEGDFSIVWPSSLGSNPSDAGKIMYLDDPPSGQMVYGPPDSMLTVAKLRFRQFASGDLTKTANTTLSVVFDTGQDLRAGVNYNFRIRLFVDASAVGGHKYDLGGGSCTATALVAQYTSISNTANLLVITSRQTSLTGAIGQAGATSVFTEIVGRITVNAEGTFGPRFAQNAASGTSTCLAGSFMEVWKAS